MKVMWAPMLAFIVFTIYWLLKSRFGEGVPMNEGVKDPP